MTFYQEYGESPIVLPVTLLEKFKEVFSKPEDFLVWLYFYKHEGIAPSQISERTGLSLETINKSIDSLRVNGNLEISLNNMEAFRAGKAFQHLDELMGEQAISEPGGKSVQEEKLEGLQEVTQAFEAEMGSISPMQLEELRHWMGEDGFGADLILLALKEAALNRKVSLNYIKAILRNWRNEGISTLKEVEAMRQERKESPRKPANGDDFIPTEGVWNAR